jgi:hypothetical protein
MIDMCFARTYFRHVRHQSLGAAVIGAMLSIGFDVALASRDAAFAASAYAVTVPRGGQTPVELRTLPNALCELGAMNSPSSQRLTAISDGGGIVRYFVNVNSTARTGILATLECTNSKAHTLLGFTFTPGAPAPHQTLGATGQPAAIPALTTTARFGVLRGTPAGFDVTTASAAQLAQLHYPPRPDSRHSPLGYAMWLKTVTTPGVYVPAVPILLPSYQNRLPSTQLGRVAQPSRAGSAGALKPQNAGTINEPTTNLCGSIVFQFTAPFSEIDSSWSVPQVSQAYVGLSTSSTMVAMNAMSEGTEQDAFNYPYFGNFSSYYVWYQFGATRYGFNFPISPSDYVSAEMGYIGSGSDSTGDFSLYDRTTNQSSNVQLPTPPGAGNGYGAESRNGRNRSFRSRNSSHPW